jgi:hypothetical protein
MQHQAGHRQVNECLRCGGEFLVVFRETSLASQPRKGPLDDPATRQHLKARRGRWWLRVSATPHPARRPLDHRDGPAERRFDPVFATSPITRIDPQMGQTRQAAILSVEYQAGAIAVGDVGGMHDSAEDQALGVDQEVAFAPTQFLRPIIAAGPPFSVVLTDWLSRMAALGVG